VCPLLNGLVIMITGVYPKAWPLAKPEIAVAVAIDLFQPHAHG
jgi:hypothetical protein